MAVKLARYKVIAAAWVALAVQPASKVLWVIRERAHPTGRDVEQMALVRGRERHAAAHFSAPLEKYQSDGGKPWRRQDVHGGQGSAGSSTDNGYR